MSNRDRRIRKDEIVYPQPVSVLKGSFRSLLATETLMEVVPVGILAQCFFASFSIHRVSSQLSGFSWD